MNKDLWLRLFNPLFYKGLIRFLLCIQSAEEDCPWCGSELPEDIDFRVEESGYLNNPHGVCYWASGTATCEDCGHHFHYSFVSN